MRHSPHPTPSLLSTKRNCPVSLRLSPEDTCSPSLRQLCAALCWTLCSSPTSLPCWGAQHWTQQPRGGLASAEWRPRIPSLHLLRMQPRTPRAAFAPTHVAGSCSAWRPPAPPGPLLTSCSPAIDGHVPGTGLNTASPPASSVQTPGDAALLLRSSGTWRSCCRSRAEKTRQGSTASACPAFCPFPRSCKGPPKGSLSPACCLHPPSPNTTHPPLAQASEDHYLPSHSCREPTHGVFPTWDMEGGRHDLNAGNIYCAQRSRRGCQRDGGQDPERPVATCWGKQRDLLQGIASGSRCPPGAASQIPRTWPLSLAGPFGSTSCPTRQLGREGRGGEESRGQEKRAGKG